MSHTTIAEIIAERDQLRADLAAAKERIAFIEHDRDDANGEAEVFRQERDAARAELENLKQLNEQTRHEGIKLAGELTRTAAERAESDDGIAALEAAGVDVEE